MHNRSFFNYHGGKSALELAEKIGATIPEAMKNRASTCIISDIKSVEEGGAGDLSLVHNKKYHSFLQNSRSSACIIRDVQDLAPDMIQMISDDPYYSYSKALNLLFSEKEIILSKPISDNAHIGCNVKIGMNVIIEDNAVLGDGCIIESGAVIKHGVKIGANSKIGANAYIAYAYIGNNCVIHPGVRIGTDGFGFVTYGGSHHKILHIGKVVIGDYVEIGANSTIDRGSVKDTIVGSNTIIDNLVQIGHNVEIGKGCIIVSQVGIAGSTKLGDYVVVGGQAGISGHLNIANMVQIAGKSGVISDINQAGMAVGGLPSVPIKDWHRQTILIKNMIKKERKDDN